MGLLQPGRLRRSGKSNALELRSPRASPPITGVNGRPVAERKIPPNCHAFAAHLTRPIAEREWGSSQVACRIRFWRTSKSESPRPTDGSKINEPTAELLKLVTATEEEL